MVAAKKDLVGGATESSQSVKLSTLQRPNNKHHGLAARGVTKSFDDTVLSPETARKKRATGGGGGQKNGTNNKPRGGVRKPAISPEMLQNKKLTAQSIQADVEGGGRKMKKDAPCRPRTTSTSTTTVSKDSRNGDKARGGGQQKPPPQPKM